MEIDSPPARPCLAGLDPRRLQAAYATAATVTRAHSRTFYLDSALLPPEKRRAARALYALCRRTDDLVDKDTSGAQARLDQWQALVLSGPGGMDAPILWAWWDTQARYGIPTRYVAQLIDGIRRDLVQSRYETFEDLATYCYGVASTVGLMVMHIIGYSGRKAIPYAIRLGVALQLTNILRDIHEDAIMGRIYLPQEELARLGLSDADILEGRADDRWQTFMRFQIERTRQLYEAAIPGIGLLSRDGRFAILAAAELYRAILDEIKAARGDVFSRRAHVGSWGKLRRLPAIWWRARHLEWREA